jgi:hypothetical protein
MSFATHVHAADGFTDHGVGVVTDLAVRNEIVGADRVALVDVGLRHELVDLYGPGGLQRNALELVLRHLDVGVLIDRKPLHDVLGEDLLTGVDIDLHVFYAMDGVAVDRLKLMFSESEVAGNNATGQVTRERRREALPIGAWGHDLLQTQPTPRNRDSNRDKGDVPEHLGKTRVFKVVGAAPARGIVGCSL